MNEHLIPKYPFGLKLWAGFAKNYRKGWRIKIANLSLQNLI